MAVTARSRVRVNTPPTMEITSWFIEPVTTSTRPNQTGPVRVWGSATDGRDKTRWWRSSSIQQRVSSRTLKTRFGTLVKLKGAICEEYARKLMMNSESIQTFRAGFPPKWQTVLPHSFSPAVFENKLNEPRPSRRSDTNPSKKKTSQSLDLAPRAPTDRSDPSSRRKSKRRKSVAFAHISHPENTADIPRKRVRTSKVNKTADDVDSGKTKWSQAQISSFERQRNSVPADDPNYWQSIAGGVPRKTAAECRKFWESTWASPAQQKSPRKIKRARFSLDEPVKIGSPEVSIDLRKGMKARRRTNSVKFRTEVRKMAAAVAQAADDEALEPKVETPTAGNRSIFDSNASNVPKFATSGTPGSEVRKRRATAEQQGIVATPEILARGKTFGLREADHYISLFKRRAASATEN